MARIEENTADRLVIVDVPYRAIFQYAVWAALLTTALVFALDDAFWGDEVVAMRTANVLFLGAFSCLALVALAYLCTRLSIHFDLCTGPLE